MSISVDEIVVTAGALEALNLALQAVTRPGDTIAVESPTFYGCLQAVQRAQLNVVEIPTHPGEGLDLAALEAAIQRGSIRACWLMTTLHHPTGSTLSAERKQRLVQMLAERSIPLIEDDAYAELQFSAKPAPPAKGFDRNGLVLHCGSSASAWRRDIGSVGSRRAASRKRSFAARWRARLPRACRCSSASRDAAGGGMTRT